MTNRLQNNIPPPKKTLTELLNDKLVVTAREVVHCIKDNSIPRLFNSQSLHVVSHVSKYRFLLLPTNLNTSSQTK